MLAGISVSFPPPPCVWWFRADLTLRWYLFHRDLRPSVVTTDEREDVYELFPNEAEGAPPVALMVGLEPCELRLPFS